MKDLEIRGAGDLLGGEQSGFINEMGFETYQKILDEAITELKENEFAALYNEHQQGDKKYVKETQLDADFELLFPDDYINNISERLNLYTELSTLETEEALYRFETNIKDRFGPLPVQALDLLNSVRIKWVAAAMGLEKIVLKKGKMTGYFIADQQSDYYQSSRFKELLNTVQANPGLCKIKEKETRKGLRLLLIFDHIATVEKALEALSPFTAKNTPVA
ncbi:MAG: transcription-repair coupling factor, partial [Sinomicrobium sp.]|nr:transcription-repair coupling factor [Sinomicrobium sp.]